MTYQKLTRMLSNKFKWNKLFDEKYSKSLKKVSAIEQTIPSLIYVCALPRIFKYLKRIENTFE